MSYPPDASIDGDATVRQCRDRVEVELHDFGKVVGEAGETMHEVDESSLICGGHAADEAAGLPTAHQLGRLAPVPVDNDDHRPGFYPAGRSQDERQRRDPNASSTGRMCVPARPSINPLHRYDRRAAPID